MKFKIQSNKANDYLYNHWLYTFQTHENKYGVKNNKTLTHN